MRPVDENNHFYLPVGGGLLLAIILYFVYVSGPLDEAMQMEESVRQAEEADVVSDSSRFDPSILNVYKQCSNDAKEKLQAQKNAYGFTLEKKFKDILSSKDTQAAEFLKTRSDLESRCRTLSDTKVALDITSDLASFSNAIAVSLVLKLALTDSFVESLRNTGIQEVRRFKIDATQAGPPLVNNIQVEMVGTYAALRNWMGNINREGDDKNLARVFCLRSMEITPENAEKNTSRLLIKATFSVIPNDDLFGTGALSVSTGSGDDRSGTGTGSNASGSGSGRTTPRPSGGIRYY